MTTVLLVDDEEWILELLPERLREAGATAATCKILTASNAADALCHIDDLSSEDTGGPVTVLSDFNLGTPVDGIDLLGEVGKRLPRARRVLMSGQSPEVFAHRLKKADLDGFVEKPMQLGGWVQVMERILRGRPFPSATPDPEEIDPVDSRS